MILSFFRNQNLQNEGPISALKSQVACPPSLVKSLMKQTELSESQIQVRYIMFKTQYPSGYVGPNVLHEICKDVLNEQESDEFVEMVFRFCIP